MQKSWLFTENSVLLGKLGNWKTEIEGEHPSLGLLGLFGPTGLLGRLKTVEF